MVNSHCRVKREYFKWKEIKKQQYEHVISDIMSKNQQWELKRSGGLQREGNGTRAVGEGEGTGGLLRFVQNLTEPSDSLNCD